MTERILEKLLAEETVSGQLLSEELGVTRAAVWKQIEQLRAKGFTIEALGRQGYRLTGCPDSVWGCMIQRGLTTQWAGRQVVYLPTVDSTNRAARELAREGAAHGTLVLTDEQTAGRGRRGRSWVTPPGEALTMSIILRPQVHPSQVALMSLVAALSVAKGIEKAAQIEARIKWPNDIVAGGKKICGMLLEMNADEMSVHDVVLGVGINVHQREFDESIRETASSLALLSGRTVARAEIVRAFLTELEACMALAERDEAAFMAMYCAYSATLNSPVRVIGLRETFTGVARSVTPSGSLMVEDENGTMREVLAADVSVRGLMGYV